jgi:SAM-dependent methyltransferase
MLIVKKELFAQATKPPVQVEPVHRAAVGVECPICGTKAEQFLPAGNGRRPNAMCPECRSLERHRLVWLYLKQQTRFFTDRLRVLHFAPEDCFNDQFQSLPNLAAYLTADLESPKAMVKMDITQIPCPDRYFHAIICSHVLEHIPDDHKAMQELLRVLVPGGWALVMVPLKPALAATFEDPSVKTPQQQREVYGYPGHVRLYGRDFPQRLHAAGFTVEPLNYATILGPELTARHRLIDETIYVCTRTQP